LLTVKHLINSVVGVYEVDEVVAEFLQQDVAQDFLLVMARDAFPSVQIFDTAVDIRGEEQ
jgi:hypothetical protein